MTVAVSAWRQVRGRVDHQADFGAGHRWLELRVTAELEPPDPGQFVQLLIPSHASGAFLPRPMSVASVRPLRDGLMLGFLYVPIGVGTHALAALPAGAEVEALGPLGRGFPLDRPGTPVLVAGGRGVAPLLFAAESLARLGRRFELLFGARDRAHLVGLDEARRRVAGRGRLHLSTDDGSAGIKGTVVEALDRLSPRPDHPMVIHACGPHAMLAAVARWAAERRVTSWVAMESVMACGTGVCRGCPLARSARGRAAFGSQPPSLLGNRDYAMCCTEGPVFDSRDLDWERIE